MSNIERFTCTSSKPYDRHRYQLELTTGETRIFETWEEMQSFWFARYQMGHLNVVKVLDKGKKSTKSKGKGF